MSNYIICYKTNKVLFECNFYFDAIAKLHEFHDKGIKCVYSITKANPLPLEELSKQKLKREKTIKTRVAKNHNKVQTNIKLNPALKV